MLKQINELTLAEAEQILEAVYPNKTPLTNPKNYDYWVTAVNFKTTGYITMGGRPDVGILYRGGLNADGFVLPFSHSKAVLWLYRNHYDIGGFLEENAYFSEMEDDFDNLAYGVQRLSEGADAFADAAKHKWTLDYVMKKTKELLEKYYYKNYE